MLRDFVELVNEAVDEGFERGITLFMESLESDMSKDAVIEENGFDNIVGQLMTDAGVDVDQSALIEDDLSNVSDEKLDEMLAALDN